MTLFKPKTKKTISCCNKKTATLDKKHKEHLNTFKNDATVIEKLGKQKKSY